MVELSNARSVTADARAARPTVLLVEDNPADAVLVQAAMTEAGFDCRLVVAENFVQAYRCLLGRAPFENGRAPDLILLDLNLPVMPGMALLRDMRARPEWRDLRVIVFSSSRRDDERREAVALGALAFITKPTLWPAYVDAMRQIERVWRASEGD